MSNSLEIDFRKDSAEAILTPLKFILDLELVRKFMDLLKTLVIWLSEYPWHIGEMYQSCQVFMKKPLCPVLIDGI